MFPFTNDEVDPCAEDPTVSYWTMANVTVESEEDPTETYVTEANVTVYCPCAEEPTEADETDVTLLFTDQYYQRALMSDFISLNSPVAAEEEDEPEKTCEEK